ELRQMALELEKESAGLAVLEERLRGFSGELVKAAGEMSALAGEKQTLAEKLAALGEAADPRMEFERRGAPLAAVLTTHQRRFEEAELARRRLVDEQERRDAALRQGGKEEVDKELAKLETEAAARAKALKKVRGELEELEAGQRKLDQQRGDLSGRIER